MSKQENISVLQITNKMINDLEKQKVYGRNTKAVLASFRNSAGRPLSEASGVWSFLFEYLPEEFLSSDGKPTTKEAAIFATMQMYAIAQQGAERTILANEKYEGTMGKSISVIRDPEHSEGLDRRFNAMITADNIDEFLYYLRQMVQLMKSSKMPIYVNYGKLASDIESFQNNSLRSKIRLKWATDYYSSMRSLNKEDNKEE